MRRTLSIAEWLLAASLLLTTGSIALAGGVIPTLCPSWTLQDVPVCNDHQPRKGWEHVHFEGTCSICNKPAFNPLQQGCKDLHLQVKVKTCLECARTRAVCLVCGSDIGDKGWKLLSVRPAESWAEKLTGEKASIRAFAVQLARDRQGNELMPPKAIRPMTEENETKLFVLFGESVNGHDLLRYTRLKAEYNENRKEVRLTVQRADIKSGLPGTKDIQYVGFIVDLGKLQPGSYGVRIYETVATYQTYDDWACHKPSKGGDEKFGREFQFKIEKNVCDGSCACPAKDGVHLQYARLCPCGQATAPCNHAQLCNSCGRNQSRCNFCARPVR